MKILAVIAHPKKDSLTRTLFDTAIDAVKKSGHEVDILDLYERADEIPYYHPPQAQQGADSGLTSFPFFEENKKRILSADRIIIAYPVWWYAVPGVMKNWLDIITNYAFSYNGTNKATPKHKITKALIINTADMSLFYRWFCTRNSATAMVKQSCYFMGIKQTRCFEASSYTSFTGKKITQDQIQKSLLKLRKKAAWLIS